MRATPRSRWVTGVAGLAVVALALTACGSSKKDEGDTPTPGDSASPTDQAKSGGIISVNASEPQNPLVPTNTNEVGGGNVLDTLFKGLVDYDPEGQHPQRRWPSRSSPRTVRTGRSSSRRTRPSPTVEAITSKSFVDAWNYGANSKNAQLNAWFFEPIEGSDALAADPPTADGHERPQDRGRLHVHHQADLAAVHVPAAARLHRVRCRCPASAYADMAKFGEKPIGNGPYMMDSWAHNESIKVKTNPDFKGDPQAKNDGIDFKIYQTPGGRLRRPAGRATSTC